LATVIAWRRRIEKRTKDPVQDVSDDESQSIGEDTIETRPTANQLFDGTRNEKATDYSASAFPFPSFFNKRHDLEFFGNERVVLKNFHAVIPYTTDAQASAATRNPQLKLMFRLVHFYLQDEGRQPFVFFVCLKNGS
jgi:hypothetical protein